MCDVRSQDLRAPFSLFLLAVVYPFLRPCQLSRALILPPRGILLPRGSGEGLSGEKLSSVERAPVLSGTVALHRGALFADLYDGIGIEAMLGRQQDA